MLIINFFSLNFKSLEIERERVSSIQNERNSKGRRCVRKRTRANMGGAGGSKLGNLERTYFLNLPFTNVVEYRFRKNCAKSGLATYISGQNLHKFF